MPVTSPSLLVVDKDPDVRLALRMSLEFVGYRVVTAEDAREALARLDEPGRPALALLDSCREASEGEELRQRLRAAGVPLVLLTARVPGETSGIRAVLPKPFNLEELYATVAAHGPARALTRPPEEHASLAA
ncbi:response regulator [Melittangium boletus]|uniref:response regulator n=1 Tax=Melittangium boletus TaxID=83453 RepID=UPI003DA3E5A0